MRVESKLCFAWGRNTTQISSTDRRLCAGLASIFAAFLKSRSERPADSVASEARLCARIDGTSLCFDSLGRAIDLLEERIARQLLEGCEHLLLHAGAVTDGRRTFLFLGHSGAGKSTMTLEFVKRGFRFITDEYAAIGLTGRVLHPFPRSTVVKRQVKSFPPGEVFESEREAGQRCFVAPADALELEPHLLGEVVLVFPSYRSGRATKLLKLTSLESCARLLPHTFNFQYDEARLFPIVRRLTAAARAFSVEYGDASSALESLLGCFAP